MRVLCVLRLFSGLETSLATGRWRPTGVPTGHKLIEALDKEPISARVVFTCKDEGSTWNETEDRNLTIDGLKAPVTVLAGERAFPAWLGGLRIYLRELRHAWRIWRLVHTFRPDVIYIGHANLWAAGLLARFSSVPVVFRIMGVYPAMREALDGGRPAYAVMRWACRAPYAAVVVTQDGSGVESWLDRALSPEVPRLILVNGADPIEQTGVPDARLTDLPRHRSVVLFVGKLEPAKGCDAFLQGFLGAWREDPDGLHALIVGTGGRAEALRLRVAEERAEGSVTFIDKLPHDRIYEAHKRADIYVSLNRLGNLSNANLEAMKAGQCMIFPEAQPDLGIDVATDTLVPPEAARRIPSVDDTAALAAAILDLHRNPRERRVRGEAMARAASKFIPTWEQRIATEIDLLRRLASEKRVRWSSRRGQSA